MAFLTSSSGIPIYYETYGQQGPYVIMLHGLGSGTDIWKGVVPAFETQYRVVLLDLPGHGKSGDRLYHSMSNYSDIVRDVMDQLHIPEAHLMGLSMGCSVALTFAVKHPKRVSSLLLQGPVGGITPPWCPWAWPKIIFLSVYLFCLGLIALALGKKKASRAINAIPFQTLWYHSELTEMESQVSPLAVIYMSLQISYVPYIGKLHRVKAPLLLIHGEYDAFPRRYFDYILENVAGPKEHVVVPNAKHIIMLDFPDAYANACLTFLEDNGASKMESV